MAAHTDVSVDGFQDTADGDRGIFLSRQQDMGSHGGCGSLSVGSGYGDGGLVVGHELAQEIGSGHHGVPFSTAALYSGLSGWMAAV